MNHPKEPNLRNQTPGRILEVGTHPSSHLRSRAPTFRSPSPGRVPPPTLPPPSLPSSPERERAPQKIATCSGIAATAVELLPCGTASWSREFLCKRRRSVDLFPSNLPQLPRYSIKFFSHSLSQVSIPPFSAIKVLRFPEDFNISSMEGIDRTNMLEVGNEGVHFEQTNVHNSQQSNQRYRRSNQQRQR
ncbi:hypothetical protein ACFX19_002646 [Malus domestica]